jgi:two-component system, OmpR family, sensor kinase
VSIKVRLVIIISILVAAAFVVTGVITVHSTRAGMIDRVDDTLFAVQTKGKDAAGNRKPNDKPGGQASPGNLPVQAGQNGNTSPPPGDGGAGGPLDTVDEQIVKRSTAVMTVLRDGRTINPQPSGFVDDPDPLPDLSGYDFQALEAKNNHIFSAKAVEGDLDYRVLAQINPANDISIVAIPLDDVEATIRNLTLIISIVGALVLLTMTGLVWFVIRESLAPIDSMISTAGLIAGGDLSQRVDIEDERNEVGSLGRALNTMLNRIESSFAVKEESERRLRQFVADASHELRTPLTSIRGYAELYRSGAVSTPEETARVMGRIESEGTRMGHLVEDLLLLARLDQGRPLRSELVDLVKLVADAVMDAQASAPNQPISYEHDEEALVVGDADRLKQVVENLLANALIHTPPGTPVAVTVRSLGDSVSLIVADEGPGIGAADVERIFDRFYRADSSRARSSGGVGLGLSIVTSIVEAHGGKIQLDTQPGEGAAFTVNLARFLPDSSSQDEAAERKLAKSLAD